MISFEDAVVRIAKKLLKMIKNIDSQPGCITVRQSNPVRSLFQLAILSMLAIAMVVLSGCNKKEKPSQLATKNKGRRGGSRSISGVSASLNRTPAENGKPTTTEFTTQRRTSSSWSQFRGRSGRSTATRAELPTRWDDQESIYWRTALPGRGASSPVIMASKVFLTAYSGYGISAEDPGKVEDLQLHLICIDYHTGEYLWKRNIQGSPLTQRMNAELYRHGFASSTPCVDRDHVYAFFGASGVMAFDHEGELIWRADVGFAFNYFGSSASLISYSEDDDCDLLIVNASIESNTIFAIDKKTGKGVWKIDNIDRSFSMPVIGQPFDGRTNELVVMEEDFVRGYDPRTGKELWHCEGVNNYVVATPYISDGVAYCNGGLQKQMMAIKLGGKGDVTKTHKLWEIPAGANVTSPLYIAGQLYVLTDNSILQCYDAMNGELISQKRTPSKARAYASPLFSGNALYIPLEDKGVLVCEASSEFKEISHNVFESDKTSLKASLAASSRRIFLRNDHYLYCIGSEAEQMKTVELPDSEETPTELITAKPRYDFAPVSLRRPYNFYLERHRPAVDTIIIKPYETLLEPKQVEDARKLIDAKIIRFDELREQQLEAYWQFLKSGSEDAEKLESTLAKIDEETMNIANGIRRLIKSDIMSQEQLKQHIEEVAARRAKN